MKMVMFIIGAAALMLASCKYSPKAEERVCNVSGELQDSVEAILQRHLLEYDAMDGVTIVMETKSGRIRAMVGLENKGDGMYVRADSFAGVARRSALMGTVSMLAALNTGKVKPDMKVDTGAGVYLCGKDTIFDHNWHMGGYGEMTLRQTFAFNSDIGLTKAIGTAFADKKQFVESVKEMMFGQPCEVEGLNMDSCSQDGASSLPWYRYAVGCKETTPIQILTFYNAIANNGKMVAPQLYEPLHPSEDEAQILNLQIASPQSIAAIRDMLEWTVSEGLGIRAMSDKFAVAGKPGTINNEDGTLTADFCGYFSVKDTGYTVIVSVHRNEIPASGGSMAGTIFKEIAELLYKHKDTY